MKKLQGEELETAQRESAQFWAHEADGEFRQAKMSGIAALGTAAVGGWALSRGIEGLILAGPAFLVSGTFAAGAITEIREAMQLSKITGNRNPEPERYTPLN